MKRILSIIIACLLLLPMALLHASAESALPFELTAPANVAVVWLEENDSPTTMRFSYSLPNDMASFYKELEAANLNDTVGEFMSKYDYDEIWSYVQIDWAVDDVNDAVSGWHFNRYWEARGEINPAYDEDWNIRTSEWDGVEIGFDNATETVQTVWIMRGVPDDERWNGNPETKTPGVKDQLRPDQYEYYDDSVHIDFTEHTAYFRARFATVTRTDTEDGTKAVYYYSPWSETVGYGKDAAKAEPLKPGDVAAPVITGLRKTDETFNDNPVVAFTLTVPETLQKQLTDVTAAGGSIVVETEARVKGDAEWTLMGNTDWTVKPGEMECALLTLVNGERPSIPEDTVIELRCRYRVSQPEKDDFYSDYSKIISFGTDDINAGSPAQPQEGEGGNDTADPAKKKCPICHFCPQPLGLCIFIWLAIIVVIIVVIVILAKKRGKK